MVKNYEDYLEVFEKITLPSMKSIFIGSLLFSLGSLGIYSSYLKDSQINLMKKERSQEIKIRNLENKLEKSNNKYFTLERDYSNSTKQILDDEKEISNLLKEKDDLSSSSLVHKLSELKNNYNILFKKNKECGENLTIVYGAAAREINSLNKELKNFKKLYNSNKK